MLSLSKHELVDACTMASLGRAPLRPSCAKHGEQLRLAVMSAAFPVLDRNLNTGESLPSGTRMVVARQSIWHEAGKLSSVILPVIDAPRGIDPPN